MNNPSLWRNERRNWGPVQVYLRNKSQVQREEESVAGRAAYDAAATAPFPGTNAALDGQVVQEYPKTPQIA